ncbi:MAG: hypothetical protein KTR20_06415 [Cellvibrionaceae bacterium]|nr:hypothetical protein [Cellvibrionaceae bacterium]
MKYQQPLLRVLLALACLFGAVLWDTANTVSVNQPFPLAQVLADATPAGHNYAAGVDVWLRHHHFGSVSVGESFRVPITLITAEQQGSLQLRVSGSDGLSSIEDRYYEFLLGQHTFSLSELPLSVTAYAGDAGRHYIHILASHVTPSGQRQHRALSVKIDVSSTEVRSPDMRPPAHISANGRVVRAFIADETLE